MSRTHRQTQQNRTYQDDRTGVRFDDPFYRLGDCPELAGGAVAMAIGRLFYLASVSDAGRKIALWIKIPQE